MISGQAFDATIALVGQPESDARARLLVSSSTLQILVSDQIIGTWPLAELSITRTRTAFVVGVEGEQLLIEPDRPRELASAFGLSPASGSHLRADAGRRSSRTERASGPDPADPWWRFWSADAWRSWATARGAWRHYRRAAEPIDRRIRDARISLDAKQSELDKAERDRQWASELAPFDAPVKLRRNETALTAIPGIRLLEPRTRDGKETLTPVDAGILYATDRRLVFSGHKDVTFAFGKVTMVGSSPSGLRLATTSRKRHYVLDGPVERMIAVMTAARAVGEGLSPVEPFESRAAAIRAEVAAVQRDLSIAESERRDLPVARRPVSPAWVPTGALALVLVATALGSPTVVSGTVDDAATASTAEPAAVQTTSVASEPGSTTLPATTTTVSSRDLVSFTALATLAAGPSGDPAADPPAGSQPIEILSITDGDTFDARFADGSVEPIRLIGINSPEGGECMADVAGAALGVMTPVGSTVHVTSDVSDRDQFDRLLRYVWVGSLSVNEELVRRGMAIARRYPPDVGLAERLESGQATARAEQAGLWAPNACGSISAATVRVVALNYDAAGDDNVNLNGEWIQLRNLAHVAVDLTGWTIRDESATHRYGFPTGFTLGANETVTIRSGCGTDFSTTLYWCSRVSAIWNNDGDTAFIVDPNGNIHSDYSYRPATTTTAAPSTTTTPPTTSPPTTLAAPSTTTAQNCHPSYPTVCIPPPPPDLNCGDIPHRNFTVTGSDPHRFDGNNDGVGCES